MFTTKFNYFIIDYFWWLMTISFIKNLTIISTNCYLFIISNYLTNFISFMLQSKQFNFIVIMYLDLKNKFQLVAKQNLNFINLMKYMVQLNFKQ